ncbi:MAG: hypothetical protein AMXMBFR64_55060 [Myxococcales bacterium]
MTMASTAPPGLAPSMSQSALTPRSFIAGSLLAVFLCGVNSYLTLSFGVIEEGPTIAALFFFAMFFLSRTRITSTELVIVATMGSAGGSLGFITNFYAAKAMIGTPYTFWEMAGFATVTSLVGIMFVVPLRELLVVRENLPWPSSKATAGVITALSEGGDRKQPVYLLISLLIAMAYVLLNDDGGFALVPESTALPLFGLAAYGAAIAWSPFAIGGAYLMGFRTCVGFLFGGIALLIMAPHTPVPAAPHRYVWPGIAFLVASGLAVMAINWRVIAASMRSLFSSRTKDAVDQDPVLSPRLFIWMTAAALAIAIAFLMGAMGLGLLLIIMLVVVGAFVQNVIATRAAAQTAFNPARVMGVLLEGLSAMMGASAASTSLTGAGFVAGSGAQAGNLTGDMVYGRWFKVPSRWQFWTQFTTLIPCALVSAWVFSQINANTPITSIEGTDMPAPVAKMWAASALVFDPSAGSGLPPGAITAMLIAAVAGIVWVLLEASPKLERLLPSSIGFGLGLVLPVAYDFAFFLGGFVLWVILGRGLKVRDITLTTIAVGCIVAEGLGGVLKPVLQVVGVIPGG